MIAVSKRAVSKLAILFFLLHMSNAAQAQFNWMSLTVDNDLFVGNDNGYTNGLYFSLFEVGPRDKENMTQPDMWVRPLSWSLADPDAFYGINSYTIGQGMGTPSDISLSDPPRDELPYSSILFFINNYVSVSPNHADKISTTLGILGPSARGEETQKFVHDLIGADEPQGWDTQLGDELVFQLSRARLWRSFVSSSGNIDVLTAAEGNLGTIESSVLGSAMVRYGRKLDLSYHTPLYGSNRVLNPIAPYDGWYGFFGINGGYTFQWIYADGNTFKDSRSVDYEPLRLGLTAGFTYAWDSTFFTFAITENDALLGSENKDLRAVTRYGTITLAWAI